jgi:hypothetical protein
MESNIKNAVGQQVEQLTNYDASGSIQIFYINNDGAGGYGFDNGVIRIPLLYPRIYEINRVRLRISYFENPDASPNHYAYAPFEQFSIQLGIDMELTDQDGHVTSQLLKDLYVHIQDNNKFDIIFKEPFIIKTTNSNASKLQVTFKSLGSVFTTLTGIDIPPPGTSLIYVYGMFTMEGVSYPQTSLTAAQRETIEDPNNNPLALDIIGL